MVVMSLCDISSSPSHRNVATFFNFVKASIGSGSFALPWGIMQAGILVGAAGMALLGIARYVPMYTSSKIDKH